MTVTNLGSIKLRFLPAVPGTNSLALTQAAQIAADQAQAAAAVAVAATANKVDKAGDVMSGFLTLNADPTATLHAATKQYVDAHTGGAPTTVDYLVRTADATLTAERVVTDTATVAWDWSTAGQAKASAIGLAPVDAEYITSMPNATLTAERFLADSASVTWDRSVAGQISAVAAGGGGGGGNVSSSGTPAATQYAKWTTSTTIQGVAPATVLSDIGAQPAGSYLTTTAAAAAYQPLDGDLTSLAAAASTGAIYYRSAANTWAPVTLGNGVAFSGGALTATGTPQSGYLTYVSATALSFTPLNGNLLKINGVLQVIPTGGIAGLANTGIFKEGVGSSTLTASTLYYVYAFMNGSTVTADFSTTGHATSTAAGNEGVEIKSGDNTRTLIGMIYTNTSFQFQDDATTRFVMSWANRKNKTLAGTPTSNFFSSSGPYVELNPPTARVNFLAWSDEGQYIALGGTAFSAFVNAVQISIRLDGVTPITATSSNATIDTPNNAIPISTNAVVAASEGMHFIAVFASVNGGQPAGFTFGLCGLVRG